VFLAFRQKLVQPVRTIHKVSCRVSHHGLVNGSQLGNDRLDATLDHALICACAHPAAQKRLAVSDCLGHLHVTVVRRQAKAMRLAGLVGIVWLVGKMRVAELVAQLSIHDLAVVNRGDEIVGRTAKVLMGLRLVQSGMPSAVPT
jgi:hypothetical protein